MFALRHLLEALTYILDLGLTIYMWLIIGQALLSWVNPDPYNPIVRFLYNVTEPVLGWVRRRVPIVFGGLDLKSHPGTVGHRLSCVRFPVATLPGIWPPLTRNSDPCVYFRTAAT